MNPLLGNREIIYHSHMKRGQAVIGIILSTVLLSGVAALNGFPLVYYDTGTYLKSSLTFNVPVDRPVFYGLFLSISRDLPWSQWGAIALQSLFGSVLIFLIATRLLPAERRLWALLGIVSFLALGSSLPWHTGQWMPDVFAGYLGVAFYLLAFHWRSLRLAGKVFCSTLFVFSCLVHTSHLLISGALWIVVALATAVHSRWRQEEVPAHLGWIALLLLTSTAIIPVTNRLLTGETFFSKGGHVFLLARLAQQKTLYRLLSQECGKTTYALCSERENFREITSDDFIWSKKSPLKRMGGWEGSSPASWRMIQDSIAKYPASILYHSIQDGVRQIGAFETGDSLHPYPPTNTVSQVLKDQFPGFHEAYASSSQQRGAIPGLLEKLRPIHRWIFWFSAVLLFSLSALSVGRPRKNFLDIQRNEATLFFFLLCALNALVCAAVSSVQHRYESRVTWILVLLAAIAVIYRVSERRAGRQAHLAIRSRSSSSQE